MIPYGRQDINADDIAAVVRVLESDFITQGPAVPAFEARVAELCGVRHACAVSSATAALHVACLALGLGPGDLLWTSPITFVASANVGMMCGADVDFIDVDPDTLCMSADALEARLSEAARGGRLPKIVMPVHFAGQSADMARIRQLSEQYGFFVVEDGSHAIGARYGQRQVGSCEYSEVCVFSFHPVKIVTTGEGGVATTNDSRLAERMGLLRSHGITRDSSLMEGEPDGPWYYQQLMLGFNYRMTDIQAALGSSQISRLDAYVARRNAIADWYDAALRDLPLVLPRRVNANLSAVHLYPVQVAEHAGRDRLSLFNALRADGIGVNVHYIPVHLQPFWRRRGFTPGYCPAAENYYRRALSLPMYPGLGETQLASIASSLRRQLAGS
jgi:UDP-4-amino-4,6-dideoxy-N-acetyl-beta-L-altrosamine transaminase